MTASYFEYVERDRELLELVLPIQGQLASLSSQQIETLVFYLKSLHGYYPASANNTENYMRFHERLKTLRESPEQVALQRRAARLNLLAMLLSGLAGALLAVSGLVLMVSAPWAIMLAAGAIGVFLFAEARFAVKALVVAKDQDRKHFLASVRAARSCSELDWAGLFSHNGGTELGAQSEAAIRATRTRVAELSSALRAAIYNDEDMEYSSER